MAEKSAIEWTDANWNPVTGCTKVSPGCKHCYAERLANRLRVNGEREIQNGFEMTLHPDVLKKALSWRRPRRIFANSMSDLFHEGVPLDFIRDVFRVMGMASWHIFEILTKRAERLAELAHELPWPINVWQAVSLESPEYAYRADLLASVPASVRFLSVEPLLDRLEPISEMPLEDINWVIVGGESGPGHRQVKSEWVREIRDQCLDAKVPFFFKQWGGRTPKSGGRELVGRTWDELPEGSRRPIHDARLEAVVPCPLAERRYAEAISTHPLFRDALSGL